jgi:hypothetical protein
MRKMLRVPLAALGAIGLASAAAAAPSDPAPPTYVTPPGQRVETYTLAAGRGKRDVLTWAGPDSRDVIRVWVVDRSPGGSFGQPIALSDRDRSAWLPRTAVMADGTELVAWVENERDSPWSRVLVATRRPGASAFARKRLARVREPSYLSLATGVHGAAAATWVQDTKRHIGRVAVVFRSRGGHWGKPEIVTGPKRTVSNPRLALDGGGNATLAWDRRPPPWKAVVERTARKRQRGQAEVRAAVRPRGGRFGKAQVVSNPHHQATDAFLAGNARGDAILVWRTLPSQRNGTDFRLSFAYRRHDHPRFGNPHSGAWLAHFFGFPRAAIDPSGAASIVWNDQMGKPDRLCGCGRIVLARRPPGGPLGASIPLSEDFVLGPEIGTDRAGNMLVLWTPESVRREDFKSRVEGRFVGADGALGPARIFSSFGLGIEFEEAAALTGDGGALVGWHRYVGGRHRLESVDAAVP